ncbi:hypothetical protein D3C87_75520 [compost metagenome]
MKVSIVRPTFLNKVKESIGKEVKVVFNNPAGIYNNFGDNEPLMHGEVYSARKLHNGSVFVIKSKKAKFYIPWMFVSTIKN